MTLLGELDAIATEAKQFSCTLRIPQARSILEDLILRSLWQLLHAYNPDTVKDDMHWIQTLINVSDRLQLGVQLDRAQELYYRTIDSVVLEAKVTEHSASLLSRHMAEFMEFGRVLNLDL